MLPARLDELVSEPQYQYRFDPLNYRHPLVRAFQGREQAGLLTTPVYKYFRLTLDPTPRRAWRWRSTAAIRRSSKRRSTAAARSWWPPRVRCRSIDPATKNPWTTMPAWPSFVPLVQEILALAVRGQMAEHNVEVGQALGESLPAHCHAGPRSA